MSRKEKHAAKADSKTEVKRAAKASKVELLEDLLLKPRESGNQSALKRSQAHAVIASGDNDNHVSVFDRTRGTIGAPKCVEATR